MTLLDYFPKDFLLFVDESHVTLPQVRAMYRGDRARKDSLVEYGFRLPSAYDNRPLKFEEFEQRVHQAIYVSATPGDYEREHAGQIAEQIIRPTGLLDPQIFVRPIEGKTDDLIGEIKEKKKKNERALVTTLHEENGRGPLGLPHECGHPLPLPASRHRRHRAYGDHPRPAHRRV